MLSNTTIETCLQVEPYLEFLEKDGFWYVTTLQGRGEVEYKVHEYIWHQYSFVSNLSINGYGFIC
jgi:hypothetical protein